MNLANWIRTNNPGAKTDDIVGGRQIVPVSLPVTFATSLPYQAAGDIPVRIHGDFSNAYKVSVRLVYEGIDVTFTSDQLSGRRLVLYFVPNLSSQWVPTLFLDGFPIVEGTIPVPPLFTYNLQVTVTHNAYPTTVADQTFFLFTEGPKVPGSALATVYYLLGSSFGESGKGLFDHHNGLQRQYEAVYGTGPLVVQEPLIGERMAAQWLALLLSTTW